MLRLFPVVIWQLLAVTRIPGRYSEITVLRLFPVVIWQLLAVTRIPGRHGLAADQYQQDRFTLL